MKKYIKEHWRLLIGIILIASFLIVRVTLVYAGGPHDLWTELISSASFLIGLVSGCLIIRDSKVNTSDETPSNHLENEFNDLLELQNDEYNYGHNVNHDVDKYVD